MRNFVIILALTATVFMFLSNGCYDVRSLPDMDSDAATDADSDSDADWCGGMDQQCCLPDFSCNELYECTLDSNEDYICMSRCTSLTCNYGTKSDAMCIDFAPPGSTHYGCLYLYATPSEECTIAPFDPCETEYGVSGGFCIALDGTYWCLEECYGESGCDSNHRCLQSNIGDSAGTCFLKPEIAG